MKINEYFDNIKKRVKQDYEVAMAARAKGIDPVAEVEMPLAATLAEKTVGLISAMYPQINDKNIVNRILELEKEYGLLDHAVALKIAEEIAREKFCKFKSHEEAIDAGIRVGFAYITVGVVSSPLEGFTHWEKKKTSDGKDYMCLYYSGPVRSAGATVGSFSVILADYLRETFGYAKYDPTEDESKRAVSEIFDYHERITNLQYVPNANELDFLARHLPVQINGLPSEKKEVFNYKDLPRIETNFIRNGVALILGEGFCQKAHKLLVIIKKLQGKGFKLSDWGWFDEFVAIKNKEQEKKKKTEASATYISDLVAGRPVLGHPGAHGGFRLRYGRARTSGLSSMAMHPLTMAILKNYIAIGTQLKYEGPGKSSAMSLCDEIEGPIIKINDGSVVKIDSKEKAARYKNEINEIIYLGDFLVNYGEFFNRGKHFEKPGYCQEWYSLELEKAMKEVNNGDIKEMAERIAGDWRLALSFEDAAKLSEHYKVSLHPNFIFYWSAIKREDFLGLIDWIGHARIVEGKIILPYTSIDKERFVKGKRALELIGCEHQVTIENVLIEMENTKALLANLGIKNYNEINGEMDEVSRKVKENDGEDILAILNKIGWVRIRDKAGTFIGSRMGRPEKAKLRKLDGSPHVLFPVGSEGGRLRSVNAAVEIGSVKSDFPVYFCEACKSEGIYPKCDGCGNFCKKMNYCEKCDKNYIGDCMEHGKVRESKERRVDIRHYFDAAKKKLGLRAEDIQAIVKGVKGTSNKDHSCENLAKGLLRAKYNLHVNKDGTIRYDLTEMPLTHFKAMEIGTSVDKLKELGYEKDINGNELVNDEQLIEIFPQDIILPACPITPDERADYVLMNVANYVDDMLVKLYGLEKYYNLKSKDDLRGHLVLGLAPHTAAAIVGRIIGFSKNQSCMSNPMWHAAQRRDCEGDETCVMLLLEALIDFSRKFLPSHRGGTQDAPLVASSTLAAAEIDDMAFDMDIVWKYPLELYEAAEQRKKPGEVKIEQLKVRLGTEKAYYNFGFTHNVKDINDAILCSAYKLLPSMGEKVEGQMWLAEKIRAVDSRDVSRLVIERHLIRDTRGNLRKFSQQIFRCVSCNEKYRRPPLAGKCGKCGGRLIFTISQGSILKYMQPALDLARKYKVSPYLLESLELTEMYIQSIFGKESEKQEALGKWFG